MRAQKVGLWRRRLQRRRAAVPPGPKTEYKTAASRGINAVQPYRRGVEHRLAASRRDRAIALQATCARRHLARDHAAFRLCNDPRADHGQSTHPARRQGMDQTTLRSSRVVTWRRRLSAMHERKRPPWRRLSRPATAGASLCFSSSSQPCALTSANWRRGDDRGCNI